MFWLVVLGLAMVALSPAILNNGPILSMGPIMVVVSQGIGKFGFSNGG